MITGSPLPTRHPPTSTYRLQLHAGFDLRTARDLVPYLDTLGISHLYLSPILKARAGSLHGYDVVDPLVLNPELGTEDDLRALAEELAQRNMGIVLDIVPNHMAIGAENPYWEDVLRHGPASQYASWFDIDWGPSGRRLFLPVLGTRLGEAIEMAALKLVYRYDEFRIVYHDHSFPVDPATIPLIVDLATEARPELVSNDLIATIRPALNRLRRLPPRTHAGQTGTRQSEAAREGGNVTELLQRTGPNNPLLTAISFAFDCGSGGGPRIRRVLAAQAYRLAYWRRAAREINYRRFFTISHLVALRQEDPSVFAATHARIREWIDNGVVSGLRVDHVDGLLDPRGYLSELRRAAGDIPIYVEKILAHDERLPQAWPVSGTTGYEFLNMVEDVLVDWEGFRRIQARYRKLTGRATPFERIMQDAKRKILQGHLAADAARLTRQLLAVPYVSSRRATRKAITSALVETIVCMRVYRTYPDPYTGALGPAERESLANALEDARQRVSEEALELLTELLLPTHGSAIEQDPNRIAFVQRFQQLAVPVAAKGVEDTAFYVEVPLASRNEVGGEPDRTLQDAPEEFHRFNHTRQASWPASLSCTSTHDTKRSGDTRARIDVLSEIPHDWIRTVRRWRRMNRSHATRVGGRFVPDANTEYLLYQTLVGIWTAGRQGDAEASLQRRMRDYMIKAVREAKQHTSWVDPNTAYETAIERFIERLFSEVGSPFLAELRTLAHRITPAGMWNALTRTVVHLTAPGVPDIYRGDELWEFALVDPDNRRPVDYAARQGLLDGLPATPASLMSSPEDGRLKLHVTHQLLSCRRRNPSLFLSGRYQPLKVSGALAMHVIAFARVHESTVAVVVAPRLSVSLCEPYGANAPTGARTWRDTVIALPNELRRASWTNVLTGNELRPDHLTVSVATLLEELPVCTILSD